MSNLGQKSTADSVREYIDSHPITRAALQHGIVNYSALSRKLQENLNLKNFEAIQIAVRRKAEALIKIREHLETSVQKILVESSLEISTKIAEFTLVSDISTFEKLDEIIPELTKKRAKFHLVQGAQAITFVVEQQFLKFAEEKLRKSIIKKKENLVGILVKSPEKIEEIPGVVAMIMTAIAERNINIVELLSFYTDTIIIIEPKYLQDAIKVLDKLLKL